MVSGQIGSTSEIRYTAFGEIRFKNEVTPTHYRYTGQLADSYINLSWYNSRWYDSQLAHFVQPDSIIPDPAKAKTFDRYAYVNNSPIDNNDPSGHWPDWADYVVGAAAQIYDDSTMGIITKALSVNLDDVNNQAYQDGRTTGRVISTVVASYETAQGGAIMYGALSSIPPTFEGGAGCTAVSDGACALVAVPALAIEAVAAVGGAIEGTIGGIRYASIQGRPLNNSDFKKYSDEEIEKRFDLEEKQFHKEVKPEILNQLGKNSEYKNLLRKAGKNPDIGLSRNGDIQIISRNSGNKFSFNTNVNMWDIIKKIKGSR